MIGKSCLLVVHITTFTLTDITTDFGRLWSSDLRERTIVGAHGERLRQRADPHKFENNYWRRNMAPFFKLANGQLWLMDINLSINPKCLF